MAVMGMGMATPYLALSLWPEAVKHLPKPGEWMEEMRRIFAWMMGGSAVYLAWVYLGQTQPQEGLRGLLAAVGVLFGVWGVARWRRTGRWIALAVLVLGAWVGLAKSDAIKWEDWNPQRVEELRAQGRTVVVEFTARWCVNCIINERVVWENMEIREVVKKANVVLMKADWTQRDARIAGELKKFGRVAVPLVVIYKGKAEPLALPNLLTVGEVKMGLGK